MEMLARLETKLQRITMPHCMLRTEYSYRIFVYTCPCLLSLRSRLARLPTLPRSRPLMVMLFVVQKQQIQQRRGVTLSNIQTSHSQSLDLETEDMSHDAFISCLIL
ncbi:hypothetical protein V8C43DRAFT_289157, partial [Trichoderma afarasin]